MIIKWMTQVTSSQNPDSVSPHDRNRLCGKSNLDSLLSPGPRTSLKSANVSLMH